MISPNNIPSIIKYMGGKRDILNDVNEAIQRMNIQPKVLCDLFAGTAIVSYAFSDQFDIVSNDIQQYSSIFAKTYFNKYPKKDKPEKVAKDISDQVLALIQVSERQYPNFNFHYQEGMSLTQMEEIEKEEQKLIDLEFDYGFHLFKKCYSGTYWSYDQCKCIDAIRCVAEKYRDTVYFEPIMSSLIFSMSYCSQSTGHFAQYRSLTSSNYQDILTYRLKNVLDMFSKRFAKILEELAEHRSKKYRITSLDYLDCISTLAPNTLVYADPPYSSVHYSRFYHAIETIVRYDNPQVQFKGRYRGDRYQSPFDQKSKVIQAFTQLFRSIKAQRCHLLLSYSDNGMVTVDELRDLATQNLGLEYVEDFYSRDYQHRKMGRSDESVMDVHELLISYTLRT